MGTPYIGFGNDQLKEAAPIADGDIIECPHCGEQHVIEERSSEPDGVITMEFYKCGNDVFVAGINGKCVMDIKPAVSGEI